MEKAAGVRDLETVYEISRLLNTGLDRETLSILVSLCENGVNPEALAAVVRELRREAKAVVRACDSRRDASGDARTVLCQAHLYEAERLEGACF